MKPVFLFLVLTFPGAFVQGEHAFTFLSNSNSDSRIGNRNVRAQPPSSSRPFRQKGTGMIKFPSAVNQENTNSTANISTLHLQTITTTTTALPISTSNATKSRIYFENVNSTENEVQVELSPDALNGTENTTEITSDPCQHFQLDARTSPSSSITPALSDEFIKSKLCSNINDSVALSKHRFDLDAKVCSPTGQRSHCGKYMIFQSYRGSKLYGFCECDYSNHTGMVGSAPLIFHKESNRCYYIYTKAFCRLDEWLELGARSKPICTPNKCYNSGRRHFGAPPLAAIDAEPKYVPVTLPGNRTVCAKLNEPNEMCPKKSDVVAFRWPSQFYPSCGNSTERTSVGTEPLPRYIGAVPSMDRDCHPGSHLSMVGHCQPEFEFD